MPSKSWPVYVLFLYITNSDTFVHASAGSKGLFFDLQDVSIPQRISDGERSRIRFQASCLHRRLYRISSILRSYEFKSRGAGQGSGLYSRSSLLAEQQNHRRELGGIG